MSVLLPPPSAAEGGVNPSPAAPASWLNDVASLRLSRGNTFTSFHSTPLPGVAPADAFDRLYLPEAGAANLAAYEPACDYVLLEDAGVRTLEPQASDKFGAAFNDPQAIIDALTANDAWASVSHFRFVERVRVLFGVFTKRVSIEAWRCVDREARFMRYSSVADGGNVRVWKYGWVTQGPTAHDSVVHEHIVGVIAQSLFRSMAEKACRTLNAQHMDNFTSIFVQYHADKKAAAVEPRAAAAEVQAVAASAADPSVQAAIAPVEA